MKTIFSDLISLFFPHVCLACDGPMVKNEDTICSSCFYHLPKTNSHKFDHKALEAKFYGKASVEGIFSFLYFKKDNLVQRMLHRLKYKNKPEIGVFLGKLFASEIKEKLDKYNVDFIVPVPLHSSRQRTRGYNQSEQIAIGFGNYLSLPVKSDVMVRVKRSMTQTSKNRMERWENVSGIFDVPEVELVKNKSVLIIDDVMTTGATLEACVLKLKEAGAYKIVVATVAVAI